MRKFLISAVSLAALTAGGMALAEDPAATTTQGTTTEQMNQPAQPATDQNAAQPSAEQPSTTVLPKADDSTAQQQPSTTDPATTTAEQPTTTDPAKTAEQPATTDPAKTAEQPATTDPATTTAEQPATGSSGFTITGLEAGNVMMASSLIGSTIYTSANENIGDINDVVIAKDGKVLAAIIGVGGFLGLGEKDVAVPMDRIQFARDENNNMKFTISASREELEQAPAFDRTKLIVGGEAAPPAAQ